MIKNMMFAQEVIAWLLIAFIDIIILKSIVAVVNNNGYKLKNKILRIGKAFMKIQGYILFIRILYHVRFIIYLGVGGFDYYTKIINSSYETKDIISYVIFLAVIICVFVVARISSNIINQLLDCNTQKTSIE